MLVPTKKELESNIEISEIEISAADSAAAGPVRADAEWADHGDDGTAATPPATSCRQQRDGATDAHRHSTAAAAAAAATRLVMHSRRPNVRQQLQE